MRTKTKLLLGLILTVSMLSYLSCKKTDTFTDSVKVKSSEIEEKFFNTHRTADPVEKLLVDFLKKVNEKDKFVEKTVSKIGYPRWDKTLSLSNPLTAQVGREPGDSVQVFYVPFVRDSQNFVNASMLLKTTPTDTSFYFKCDWQYRFKEYGSPYVDSTAEKHALLFMLLDKATFGYNEFKLIDSNLFRQNNSPVNESRKLVLLTDSTYNSTVNSLYYHEICFDSYICGTIEYCAEHGGCDYLNCPTGQCRLLSSVCEGWWDDGGGGDDGTPGSPVGGAGGAPGGGSTPPDCGTIPTARVVDPCDEGPGWTPIPPVEDEPFVPYQCNYQLTQHEQSVFNQLDAEDDLADQNHQNLDCKGTKRTGNIFFQGTKEHWHIQLDYVSKNPVNGDVEFAIPNSSAAGNRGYADIVNLQDKSIFEIKPDNPVGWASGISEVANYVSKANQYCSSTIPMGVPWSQGGSYTPTTLPTGTPNRYLKTRLHAPGVIVYSYENISNPNPAPPVVVPTSIVDKFKHLIDRLKQNFHQADQIIAEYLQQNPDLVTYIKGAAIGAGIAIVVGTIIEDVLTAGAGIADDWACFVLSYRIIRFAIAL